MVSAPYDRVGYLKCTTHLFNDAEGAPTVCTVTFLYCTVMSVKCREHVSKCTDRVPRSEMHVLCAELYSQLNAKRATTDLLIGPLFNQLISCPTRVAVRT